jgi:SAM-dependent methyltransferase
MMMANVNSSQFWDSLYKSDQFGWDLGGPTPVFSRLADSGLLDPGKMLVLGAGRGHDARLFARRGFEVTAVDFSDAAYEAMNQLDDSRFPVEIVKADFFSLPPDWNGRFDYILDYTSFCAVLPQRRAEYADLVARLLKPQGKYIILAFPIGTRPGGPPYTVQPEAIIDLYAKRGFTLQLRESPVDSVPRRKGYEELLILRKN